MVMIERTTGVQTVVMNGNSNTRVIRLCLGRKTERSQVSSRCLNTTSDGEDATWRGRSLQAVAS